ncbi:hypothetical protein EVAR_3713_1 [Eumeta japonica]|uniref:Uncharacterized protein n=1 Tax=Eumeta variegata TaxID=151549 RepID=A0A4C1SU57_EUMVA|nr:hypothetical protein EVAR_3713_1 [Eumeta japonica]
MTIINLKVKAFESHLNLKRNNVLADAFRFVFEIGGRTHDGAHTPLRASTSSPVRQHVNAASPSRERAPDSPPINEI